MNPLSHRKRRYKYHTPTESHRLSAFRKHEPLSIHKPIGILDRTYPIPTHPTWDITDSSKLKTYMKSPRDYLFEYLFGWRLNIPNVDTAFGSAVHALMEQLALLGYNKTGMEAGLLAATKVWRKEISETDEELFDKCRIKNMHTAQLLAQEYITQFITDHFELYGTEIGGTVPISDTRKLAFKMDLVGQYPNGKFFVRDYKTTTMSLTQLWKDQWTTGLQPYSYMWALYHYLTQHGYNVNDIDSFEIIGMSIKMLKGGAKVEVEKVELPFDIDKMWAWVAEINTWWDKLDADFELLSKAKESDEFLKAFPRNFNETINTLFFKLSPYYTIDQFCHNPLQIYATNPLGFKIEFWNPLEQEQLTEVIEL